MEKTTLPDLKQNRTLKTKRWLGWLMFCMMLLYGQIGVAQVSYTYGFEDGGIGGWTNSGDAEFENTSSEACTGNNSAELYMYVYDDGWWSDYYDNNTFTSPNLGVSDGTEVFMTFSYFAGWMDYESFSLEVQWANSISGPWTTVYTIDDDNNTPTSSCQNAVVTFTPGIGDLYVRFKSEIESYYDYYYYTEYADLELFLDDILVVQGDCLPPTDLVVAGTTESSAELNWISDGDTFEVSWGEGFIDAEDGTIVPFVNGATLSGLEAETGYSFYVRQNCGDDDVSGWAGPYSFFTLCVPATILPYTENFDSYGTGTDAYPNCWSRPVVYEGFPSIVSSPSVSSNSLKFRAATDEPTYAVSPAFAEDIHNLRVRFYLRREGTSSGTIDVGVMSDPTDISTFELVQTIDQEEEDVFEEYMVSFNTTELTGGNNYIAIRQNSDAQNWYYWVDDFVVELIPSCIEPIELTATDITTTGATLSWTSEGSLFDIEIVEAGEDPTGEPTYEGVTNNFTTTTPLTGSTTYNYWVRQDCGNDDLSIWTGPFSFATLCVPVTTFPWTENFETVSVPDLPICWEQKDVNDDGDFWRTWADYGVEGSKAAGLYTDFNSGNNNDYLILPQFTLTGNERMKFTVRARSSSEPNDYKVVLSTTGNQPADFTEELMPLTQVSNTTHQEVDWIYLNEYTGNVYIAIHVPSGGLDGYYIYLDDFVVEEIPSCIAPLELTVDDVSFNSADLSWTADGDLFDIEIVEAGEEPTGIPTETGGSNPHTAEGLDPSTAYEYYVRQDCGEDDGVSMWAGPFSFTTTQIPATLNYEQDFEGTHGWALNNGDQTNRWVVGSATGNTGNSLYISNDDGVTNAYTTSSAASTVQAYRDIQIPEDAEMISFSFDWKSGGESTFDYFRVWVVSTDYNPTPGTQISTANSGGLQIGELFNLQPDWTTERFEIPVEDYAGEVVRLVFEWRNDGSGGTGEAAAIDNIDVSLITCFLPLNIEVGSITKNSAEATWEAPELGNTPEDGYVVEIRTENEEDEEVVIDTIETTDLSATLLGLDASTTYTIYIKSLCTEDTDESFWSAGVTFTTLCEYPDIEWVTEDFNICDTGSINLEVDSEGTVNWYDAEDALAPVFTGTTYETEILNETTSFWVESASIQEEQNVQLGEGTSIDNSSGSPFYHLYGGYKYQYIYTAEELSNAGLFEGPISALAFDVTQAATVNYNDFTIAIGTTEQSVATSTHISDLTQVYSNTAQATPVGINYYEFDEVFEWDGISNIVVQVNWSNNNTGNSSASARVRTHTTSSSQTTYTYTDNRTAAQILATMTGAVDNGSGSTSGGTSTTTRRPNTYFNGTVICRSPREEVVVTVTPVIDVIDAEITEITGPTATLAIEADATEFDIEYGETGYTQGDTSATLVTAQESPYTIEGLTGGDEYDVYVRVTGTCGEWFGPITFIAVEPSDPQVITAEDITKVYGDEPFVNGESDSGLALTYEVADETVATFVSGQLVIQGAGETEVTAKQAGNSEFLPAEDVTFTLTVTKADLTVTADNQTKVYDGEVFEDWTVTYDGFVYDDTASELSGELVYAGDAATAINAGTYTIEVSGLISDNYTITYEEGSLTITKATLEGITFEDQTVTYDGEEKSIFITGDLPAGVTVTYTGNEQTEVGDYEVTAHIDGGTNFENMDLEALMLIRGVLTDITLDDAEFTYDGTEKTIEVTGDLPDGVTVTYTDNAQTEAGEYEVVANIEGGEFYSDLELTATLTINKATITGITFEDDTFTYDCIEHSLTIDGDLPTGATVSYIGNNQLSLGVHTVTAHIDGGNNYESFELTAEITIEELLPVITAQYACAQLVTADVEANLPLGWETRWYVSEDATDAVQIIESSGTYYVSSINGTCESSRIEVEVVVEDISIPTGETTQQFCDSATIEDIVVNHTTGTNLNVYETATGGTALSAGTTLFTGTFYIAEQIGDCESDRLAVQVTITQTPPAIAPATITICGFEVMANVEIGQQPNAELIWYVNETTPQPMNANTQVYSGTYYASQRIGVCESPRTAITFIVNEVLPQPTASSQSFCTSAVVSDLVVTGAEGAIFHWFDSATSTDVLVDNEPLSNGTYYVSQELNGCESNRKAISVQIINTAAPQIANMSICQGTTIAEVEIPATTGVTYKWYVSPTAITALPATTVLTNGTYFISSSYNGCESERVVVDIETTPVPNAPTGEAQQSFVYNISINEVTIADLVVNEADVLWFAHEDDAATLTNPLESDMPLSDGTTYYAVIVSDNGCVSDVFAVTVTVTLGNNKFDRAKLAYYPNPTQGILNIQYAETIERVEIYNTIGQLVGTQDFSSNQITVDMGNLSNGTYLLKLHIDGYQQLIKVVKN